MSVLALALLLANLLVTPATPERSARDVAHAIETRYHNAKTLQAQFFERYTDGNGGVLAESGTVYFSRPSRMRWEYKSPEDKLFLVDGTNVWFYVPADKTASRAQVKESSDWRTPLALLTGKVDFGRLCKSIDIVDPAKAQNAEDKPFAPENTVLRCVPQNGAEDQVREVLLESDPSAHLARVVIRQPGNLETEFRFGNWQENIAISELKFHFDPPPGVAIVDEQSLADSIH
ncbi:MAG: outer membrane lipoprotein carrier protein LolA [Candidatus Acidiferrales bacterium]